MNRENPLFLPRLSFITTSEDIESAVQAADVTTIERPGLKIQKITYRVTGETNEERIRSRNAVEITEVLRTNADLPIDEVEIVFAYQPVSSEDPRLYEIKQGYQVAVGEREADFTEQNYVLFDINQDKDYDIII